MKVILYMIILSLSFLAIACQKVIDVNIPASDTKVVVEALITNESKPYQVKLSRSQSFTSDQPFPIIDNALVIISDDAGNTDTLHSTGNGLYTSSTAKAGVVGRTYNLLAVIDGKNYTAYDKLPGIRPITNMNYKYFKTDGTHSKDGYYVFFSTSVDPTIKNYSLFKITKNHNPLNPNRLTVTDYKFLGPVLTNIQLQSVYDVGDLVKLDIYSLSENAYTYYSGLGAQLQSDGGFFTTPPANAVNNISNGALGYFQTSSVARDSITIAQ